MSDKMVEGAVSVAKSLVTGWPPSLLAVIVLNVLMVGAIWWHENNVVASEEKVMVQRILSMENLLKVCVDDNNPRRSNQIQDQ
jgi:hypothetical protein